MQYHEWEQQIEKLTGLSMAGRGDKVLSSDVPDVTFSAAEALLRYKTYADLVVKVAKLTDETIWKFIFLAVTKDLTYVTLLKQFDMPCSRDYFYDRLRKFFYILSYFRENYVSFNEH